MSAKKNNMPKFSFGPDDEYEERRIKLSKTKWAMLDKYCEFVEKKTDYRPSNEKIFEKLLDNLFGTDKAFRHNEGLIRTKKPSSKPNQNAPDSSPVLETTKLQEANANVSKPLPTQMRHLSQNNISTAAASTQTAVSGSVNTTSSVMPPRPLPHAAATPNRSPRTAPPSMPSSVPTQPITQRATGVPQSLLELDRRPENS